MNILYISSFDISVGNGPGVNEREFITGLLKFDEHDCHFVIPKPKHAFPEDLPNDKFTFTEELNNKNPFSVYKHHRSVYEKVRVYIKRNEIDFIIIRAGIFSFSYNKIVKEFASIPFAMKTAGSGEFKVFNKQLFIFKYLHYLNRKLYVDLVKKAAIIDVVSPIQQESLIKITGVTDKIHFIDNGVNTERFVIKNKDEARKKLNLDKFQQIIGYAGNLPWERGGMQVVESLPFLLQKFPDIGGVILGSGAGMHRLYDRAKELNVEDKIVFTGQVPFDTVVDYINSFDIGISQLYEESQGASEQKVRQYLGCGKPVVVSPGSVNDFIEEEGFGFVVDPHDIDDFVNKVEAMLSYPHDYMGELSHRIRKYAEDYLSIQSKINQRLELYKKFIG